MNNITAVLTVYKRPHMLNKQIRALELQSVPIDEIIVVQNKSDIDFDYKPKDGKIKVIKNSVNFKFHARFAVGLLAKSEYILLLDDDIVPGGKFVETCLDLCKKENAVYGGTGVRIYNNSYSSNPNNKYGWNVNREENEVVTEVDLVGHAWFFKRDSLQYMWREDPVSWENGEDIQFSYLCQKYGNLKTYVTPHPKNDTDMWCNVIGHAVGNDKNATWLSDSNHGPLRTKIVKECINRGWKCVEERLP